MNFENTNDRTNHNRLAEQLAARLREECAAVEPITEPVIAQPTPKRTRRARVEPLTIVVPEAMTPAGTVSTEPVTFVERLVVPAPELITCEQNSPEWQRVRMGLATASSFQSILTPGKTKTEQKTRQTYLLKLAGEILTGQPMEMVTTRDMERGHAMEPEARDLYALQTGAELTRVGFVRNGRAGCSPDSLIGLDGGLEIKTKAPHLLIDVILKDEFPEEHKAQVQGTLWLTDREWWDIAVYWPGLPLFVKRVWRDEAYIRNLASEVDRFNTDLDAIVDQIKRRIETETNGFEFAAAAA